MVSGMAETLLDYRLPSLLRELDAAIHFRWCRKHVRARAARVVECELANSDLTRPAIRFLAFQGPERPWVRFS